MNEEEEEDDMDVEEPHDKGSDHEDKNPEDADVDSEEGEGDNRDEDPDWTVQEEYERPAETKRRLKNLKLKVAEEEIHVRDFIKEMEDEVANGPKTTRNLLIHERLKVLEALQNIDENDRDINIGKFVFLSFNYFKKLESYVQFFFFLVLV